jgi:hypothetical protein
MRAITDKRFREIQTTHFMLKNFSPKSCRSCDDVEEYCIAGEATEGNITRRTRFNTGYLRLQTHTQNV